MVTEENDALSRRHRTTEEIVEAKVLYRRLGYPLYNTYPYSLSALGEDMEVVNMVINGWWKPRYLVDRRTGCAYEFMNDRECLLHISDEDIDFAELVGISEEYMERIRRRDAHFPTHIHNFKGDTAIVKWEINPDGMYFMDDDGFGMSSEREYALYGTINREGLVVDPFRPICRKKSKKEELGLS